MAKRLVARARRFQVSRKGELRLDEQRFNGLIQNISQNGMFVVGNYDLEVGMELWIKVELAPGLPFDGRSRSDISTTAVSAPKSSKPIRSHAETGNSSWRRTTRVNQNFLRDALDCSRTARPLK